uniref:Uncharacterized protein n=1 Tax=Arundo donax TaxID=35708 RepID=A0A0A9GWI1_ARUDO
MDISWTNLTVGSQFSTFAHSDVICLTEISPLFFLSF